MPTNNYRYKNRHPQVRDVVELSGNNEDLAVVQNLSGNRQVVHLKPTGHHDGRTDKFYRNCVKVVKTKPGSEAQVGNKTLINTEKKRQDIQELLVLKI